jgi:hypothetical protein
VSYPAAKVGYLCHLIQAFLIIEVVRVICVFSRLPARLFVQPPTEMRSASHPSEPSDRHSAASGMFRNLLAVPQEFNLGQLLSRGCRDHGIG